MNLREDLEKRWRETGKVGFERVRSYKHAMELIETVVQLYEEEQREISSSLKDLAKELKYYL